MRILIVSRTPWNNSNSFGNTFTNLFGGMEDVQIFNVCCQDGKTDNQIVERAYQMTDKSVLRSAYKKASVGWEVKEIKNEAKEEAPKEAELNTSFREKKNIKKNTVTVMIRDMFWKIGKWKKDKGFNAFLEEVSPDFIYLPVYGSWYMLDVAQYIVDKLKVPYACHITDDFYTFPKYTYSPLKKFYSSRVRKKTRKIVGGCEYLEVFAANMQREYSKIFNKPCYLIGKGVHESEIAPLSVPDFEKKEKITFAYTGNLGVGRYKALTEIGMALDGMNIGKELVLDVYSASKYDDEIKSSFEKTKCISFKGAISRDEVTRVQKEADALIHVESFDKKNIALTKMSFSTKIIDYMMMGKPVLAVGPSEVNSISYLTDCKIAFISDENHPVKDTLTELLTDKEKLSTVLTNTHKFLIEKRNIDIIQKGIKARIVESVYKYKN